MTPPNKRAVSQAYKQQYAHGNDMRPQVQPPNMHSVLRWSLSISRAQGPHCGFPVGCGMRMPIHGPPLSGGETCACKELEMSFFTTPQLFSFAPFSFL